MNFRDSFSRTITFAALCLMFTATASAQDLWIDFNSTSQDGDAHNHPDYQPYDAAHEVPEDFNTKEYEAFGTTVSFTPSFPDSADQANTMQSIDRGTQGGFDGFGIQIVSSHDFFWFAEDEFALEDDTSGNIDVVTDWIGVDTRTGNGGNGDFDGENGDPTRMLFTLSGVPAGNYNWVSFHHDTEWMHGSYWFDYSVDGGNTFQPVGDREFTISKSRPDGNPPSPDISHGLLLDEDGEFVLNDDKFTPIDLKDLPSTVEFDFTANGQDIVMQFTPLSAEAVHTQFALVNAFQLSQTSVQECDPNSQGDLDGNGIVEFADFLILSGNFGNPASSHTEGDIDCNGTVDFADFLALSGNFGQSVGGAESVPEPGGLALFGLSGMVLGCLRRRRN